MLDVGCSRKPYYPLFAPFARSYVGVDMSDSPGIPDCLGSAETLPFRDGSFDVVLSTQMIAYLDDPRAGLAEWRRVLRPGGLLLLGTHGLFPNMRDRWRYTDTGLVHLVGAAGFELVELLPSGGAAMALFQLLALYVNLAMEMAPPLRRPLGALVAPLNVLGVALDRLAGRRAAHFASANYLVVARRT